MREDDPRSGARRPHRRRDRPLDAEAVTAAGSADQAPDLGKPRAVQDDSRAAGLDRLQRAGLQGPRLLGDHLGRLESRILADLTSATSTPAPRRALLMPWSAAYGTRAGWHAGPAHAASEGLLDVPTLRR